MDERNLSPDVQELLKLRFERMKSYRSLADSEAAEMGLLIRKAVGVDIHNPAEKWELDLERGVLRRVSSQPE